MSTELTTVDSRMLAALAQEQAATMPMPAGHTISVRGGILMYDGEPMGVNRLVSVVMDSVYENTYYTDKFDPDTPQSPRCYATARESKDLSPHPTMQAFPDYFKPQGIACGSCAWNAYKTAANGKGKACQNRMRLWLLPAGKLAPSGEVEWFTTPEHYGRAEIATMRLPVTSVRNMREYVGYLNANVHRPTQAVATGITVVPDPKSQWKINFQYLASLPDEIVAHLLPRAAALKAQPFEGYQPPAGEEDAGPNRPPF